MLIAASLLEPGGTLHLVHVALALPRWPNMSAAMLEWERTYRLGAHALRVLCVLGSNIFYFLGLAALPLAASVKTEEED